MEERLSREGTSSEKYDLRHTLFGTDDVLPMWVADMDLPSPPFIIRALQQRLQHPILGYTLADDGVYQAIIEWQAQHHYEVKRSDIVFTHNVANGFYMAVQAFTDEGDAILVQPPIYPPFLSAPESNKRQLINAPLTLVNGRYQIDFDTLEQRIIDNQVKLFLFCNPQNPSGRVWLKTELMRIANICLKHQVIIVSDEIHSDLVFTPHQHTPIASLSNEIAFNTITLNAPGKTFNLGGLQIGYAIIHNPKLKADYLKLCQANKIDGLNLFAYEAVKAAYSEEGKAWRDQLLSLFSSHIDRLDQFCRQHLPLVNVMRPNASYLVWLDFRAMFDNQHDLKHWLIHDAKLGLNDGCSFGGESQAGDGFMRINLAVSRETLEKALHQLKNALPH